MPTCSEERDMRVTALLDLASAAEGLNCKKISILFRQIWKNLASYMRRHSVVKTQQITSHIHIYTVHIDSLINIIKSIIISVKSCICLFL